MCSNCSYLKSFPEGVYCSILNSIITIEIKCTIKSLPFVRLKEYIQEKELCIRKLGYPYERVCEESDGICLECRKLIIRSDLNGN